MSAPDAAPAPAAIDDRPRFTLRELAGGLGDLGTFLPLSLAASIACGLDLAVVLAAAGAMNVLTGLWFRRPVPVQPMKTIAAVAIADGLTGGAIAAAGIFVAAALLLLAATGAIDRAVALVPEPLVRGLQLGVGLRLVIAGVERASGLPALEFAGGDGLPVAIAVLAALALLARRTAWLLPLLVVTGFVLAAGRIAAPADPAAAAGPDGIGIVLPTAAEWRNGILEAGIPQLPLTLLNSVLAVCAISCDLYPGRGIPPRTMATSVAWMNLACVPFGALPMCHGAGGLAAQHRFGARTGGSVIMLGGLKLLAAAWCAGLPAGRAAALLAAFPSSILAPLLVLAGCALAGAARRVRGAVPRAIVAVTAGGIVVAGTLEGVVAGAAATVIATALAAPAARRRPARAPDAADRG